MKQHTRNMNTAALEQKHTKATQKHMRDNTADIFRLLQPTSTADMFRLLQHRRRKEKRAANFHDKLRSFAVSPCCLDGDF